MSSSNPPLTGFAFLVRDFLGREFLCVQTFGLSRRKAKSALNAIRTRQIAARAAPYEPVSLIAVEIKIIDSLSAFDNLPVIYPQCPIPFKGHLLK